MDSEEIRHRINLAFMGTDKSVVGPLKIGKDEAGNDLYNTVALNVFLSVIGGLMHEKENV